MEKKPIVSVTYENERISIKKQLTLDKVCVTSLLCIPWADLWPFNTVMYRSNRSFNIPPPGKTPGHLTFLKIIVQIPPYTVQNAVQMPLTRVHSGDQMPPPRGHFTGTKMTEGRRKRLQLSNKIFINITKTEKHC